MNGHQTVSTWLAAALAVCLSPVIAAAPFQNGSFEFPDLLPEGGVQVLQTGDTRISGWVAGGTNQSLTWIKNADAWTAHDGNYLIGFERDSAPGGWIEQIFDTVPARSYRINLAALATRFSTAGGTFLRAEIFSDHGDLINHADFLLNPSSAGQWTPRSFSFTAVSSVTTLRFSEVSHQSTIRIDNVSLEEEDAADSSSIVYFLFADGASPPRDSFVLPLTRTNDIEHVRTWLRTGSPPGGQSAPIVRIARGPDGINRDHVASGAPQWSWRVVQLVGFAQGVPGTILTTPTYVEGNLDEWLRLFRGVTAFFHQPRNELPRTFASRGPSGLELRWSDLGLDYVYTLEVATSLDPGNWAAPANGTWPTRATHWTDSTAPGNQARFYRVKAQPESP